MKRLIPIKSILTGVLAAVIFTLPVVVGAQHFEGNISVQMINDKKEIEEFLLSIKENRLKFTGSLPGSNNMVPVSGESVLLRADQRDLIIFGDDNTAIKINFQEIETMVNMFSKPEEKKEPVEIEEPNIHIEETGETRTIHGYISQKFLVTDKDKPENEAHVWMTEELNINWKQMLNAFGSLSESLGLDDFGSDWGWDYTQTPLLIQVFEKGELTGTLQVSSINEKKLSKDEIDVPDGFEVMSFFQMMMRQGQR